MIILPWLQGLIGIHRVPGTWILVFLNIAFAFLTFPEDLEGSRKIKKLVTRDFLRFNGRIYADYLNQNQEEGSHLSRQIAGRTQQVEDAPEVLGALALQDHKFIASADQLILTGDQVALSDWRQKITLLQEAWTTLPSYFWGLSTDSTESVQWISHAFTHGGYTHLVGNMYFLLIFGAAVELWLGTAVFLLGYLGCGLFSAIAYILFQAQPGIPIVGASGAISGIMGLFCARHFNAKINFFYMLLPIPVKAFMGTFMAPAGIALLLWMLQDFTGMMSMPAGMGGVGHAAHLGGFLAGLSMGFLIMKFEGVKVDAAR